MIESSAFAMAVEPWVDPALFSWLPGVILGVGAALIAILMAFVGASQSAGQSMKPAIYGLIGLMLLISAALAAVGGLAYAQDQPEALASSFVWSGLIGVAIFGTMATAVPSIFRKFD